MIEILLEYYRFLESEPLPRLIMSLIYAIGIFGFLYIVSYPKNTTGNPKNNEPSSLFYYTWGIISTFGHFIAVLVLEDIYEQDFHFLITVLPIIVVFVIAGMLYLIKECLASDFFNLVSLSLFCASLFLYLFIRKNLFVFVSIILGYLLLILYIDWYVYELHTHYYFIPIYVGALLLVIKTIIIYWAELNENEYL